MRIAFSFARGVLLAAVTVVFATPVSAQSAMECQADPDAVPDLVGAEQRIGWTQDISNAAPLGGLAFRLSINDDVQVMNEVSCSEGAEASSFECHGPLPPLTPGVHRLCVGAVADNGAGQGAWSTALWVRVDATTSDPNAATTHLTTLPVVLDDPTDLGVLPDGRVVVAERGGTIRIVDAASATTVSQRLPDVVTGDGRGLLSVAIDREFATTRRLFALYSVADGVRLARYDLVNGTLTGRAILRDVLPVASAHPSASVRMGPDHKLYVALDDAGMPAAAFDIGALQGKVLRLNTDGTTPDDRTPEHPVHLAGIPRPAALAWTGNPPELWVAARDATGSVIVLDDSTVHPVSREGLVRFSVDAGSDTIRAQTDVRLAADSSGAVFVSGAASDGGLLRLTAQQNRELMAAPVAGLERLGVPVRAMAAALEPNVLYVATAQALLRFVVATR